MGWEDVDEDFEFCGVCPVCDDPVDHSESGVCACCGEVFHWGSCGTWGKYEKDGSTEHVCNNCMIEE